MALRIKRETIALIGIILVIFTLMFFLEMRNAGYAFKDYEELSSCQILKSSNGVYRLARDIETGSSCFLIAADNVTLDLNNHVITGDGGVIDYGVSVIGNGVVVKNGIIRNFNIGVFVNSSRDFSLTDSQLENNFDSGIALFSSAGAYIADNLFLSNSYYGAKLLGSYDGEIFRNTFYGNFDTGLFVNGGGGNLIAWNVATYNSWNGITLYKSSDNTASRNIAERNFWNGISLISSSKNNINYNIFVNNSRGIYLFSANNNFFSGNNLANNSASSGGIYLANSNGNVFQSIKIYNFQEKDYAIGIASSGKEQSANNLFQDIEVNWGDIYSRVGGYSSNFDNRFLNVNYDEEILAGSEKANEIERLWWLEIYTRESGTGVPAKIEIHDNYGNIILGESDSRGYFKKALYDYVKTAERKEGYNYRVNVIYNGERLSKLLKIGGNRAEVFEF